MDEKTSWLIPPCPCPCSYRRLSAVKTLGKVAFSFFYLRRDEERKREHRILFDPSYIATYLKKLYPTTGCICLCLV